MYIAEMNQSIYIQGCMVKTSVVTNQTQDLIASKKTQLHAAVALPGFYHRVSFFVRQVQPLQRHILNPVAKRRSPPLTKGELALMQGNSRPIEADYALSVKYFKEAKINI